MLTLVLLILIVVCEVIGYVSTTPRPREQYIQVYILGANHMIANYYPNDNSNIGLEESLKWYLGVTNNMGSVQLVSIRVKVSNQSIQQPNDTQASESKAPVATDFSKFLQDNETWEVPFTWNISNATTTEGSVRILTMQIDNETYQIPNWSARSGYNFCLIFEIWTWQTDSNTFEFGWTTNGDHHVAWLQMWFNMTTPTTGPR